MDNEQKLTNPILLDSGWMLSCNGELRENSTTGFGTIQKPANEHEKCKLQVQFWTMRTELVIDEFDNRKTQWLADAHQRMKVTGNTGGPCVPTDEAVAILNTLKAKVVSCQEQLAEAEENLELATPSGVHKKSDISEQNRQRLSEFEQAVKHIEI